MSNTTPVTFEDLEFFQREHELHTIALAYVQAHFDVKNMTLDEFAEECHAAYNLLNAKRN